MATSRSTNDSSRTAGVLYAATNGPQHPWQAKDLAARACPLDPDVLGVGDAAGFDLADGGLQLAHWSADIALRRYEDGSYSIIAGHLDNNETASHRVAPADQRFVYVMHCQEAAESDERIDSFFTATRWQ